jgi:hypothetical protein
MNESPVFMGLGWDRGSCRSQSNKCTPQGTISLNKSSIFMGLGRVGYSTPVNHLF